MRALPHKNALDPGAAGRCHALALVAWAIGLLVSAGMAQGQQFTVALQDGPLPQVGQSAEQAQRFAVSDLLKGEGGEVGTFRSDGKLPAGRYRVDLPIGLSPWWHALTSDLSVTVAANGATTRVDGLMLGTAEQFTSLTLDVVLPNDARIEGKVTWAIGEHAKLARAKHDAPGKPDAKAAAIPQAGGDPLGGGDALLGDLLDENTFAREPDGMMTAAAANNVKHRLMLSNVTIQRLPAIAATEVVLDKLHYKPGEPMHARITLKNHERQSRTGRLTVAIVQSLDDVTVVQEQPLQLDAMEERTLELSLEASGHFGQALRVSVTQDDGGEIAFTEAYFAVADRVVDVGIGWGRPVMTQLPNYTDVPRDAWQRYSNLVELFFWAPCDWAKLVSPLDQWWSGQTSYAYHESNLHDLIARCHARGIGVAAYASCNPAGPFGWETARQYPQWFSDGRLEGRYNVEQLDKWNDPQWRATQPEVDWWLKVPVDLKKLDALDYGIDQVSQSISHYDWDLVRYDGHYRVGVDALSTRNMRRLKQRVWQEHPGFQFGFNWGRAPEWQGGWTHELREAMAGGGMFMQEGIRSWAYTDERYRSWSFYRDNELRIAKRLQDLGGHYYCIWALESEELSQADRIYKLVYGLIAGGHPSYGSHAAVPGAAPGPDGRSGWGALMTRWSGMLWDRANQVVGQPERLFSLHGEGTDRLDWRKTVQSRVLSPRRKVYVLHLVNPPTDDVIGKGQLPEPTGPVAVMFTPASGETVARVMAVRPERQPSTTGTPMGDVLSADADGRFTVGPVRQWAMVLVEVEGAFEPWQEPAAFTEPPDLTSVEKARGRAVSADPNKSAVEESLGDNAGDVVAVLNHGSANIGNCIVPDPASPLGMVQGRAHDEKSKKLGLWWVCTSQAGVYDVKLRVKWTDPDGRRIAQKLVVELRDHENWDNSYQRQTLVTPGSAPGGAEDVTELEAAGQYITYHVGRIDKRQPGCINFVSTATTEALGTHELFQDRLVLELVEPYTDGQQAQWREFEKPAPGLGKPSGLSPRKVLFVRGMFWQAYLQAIDGVDAMTQAYGLPDSYEALYAYDTVVLANVAPGDLRQRYRLTQWVRDGGRLVVLGGPFTLDAGPMRHTFLDELLPFDLADAPGALQQLPTPMVLRRASGDSLPGQPSIFWRHALPMREGATALAFAGGQPIAAQHRVGDGVVVAFLGAPIGEGGHDLAKLPPFWQTDAWARLFTQMTTEPLTTD